MKYDKVEIGLKRGNLTVSTIDLTPKELNTIREALKLSYAKLDLDLLNAMEDGFSEIADAIYDHKKHIYDLIEKLHD